MVFQILIIEEQRYRFFKPFSNNFITTYVNRLLIEKPDFNHSNNVSFALVALYTLFRQNDNGQLKLFETDLSIKFEDFVKLVLLRNKQFDFRQFYVPHKTYTSENGEEIIELRKSKKGESYRDLEYPLPTILLAKKTFVIGYD